MRSLRISGALALALLGTATGSGADASDHAVSIGGFLAGVAPTPVAPADVPQAARESAQRELGVSAAPEVTEQMHNGDLVYQFNSRDASGPHSVIVNDDGHVVHKR